MKTIFTIAKTELRNLFYSPVAWFLSIVFMIQCAVFYTSLLSPLAKMQDILQKNNPSFKEFPNSLTRTIFFDTDGIFVNILQNLFLFIPLLTMGLISREINNGTIKLLYSSPVKARQIVLGKYLAIMIYNLLLVLIVGIFLTSGFFNIQFADYGIFWSAALGFYLLLCAYTAIGLFMSSLTNYQIVAAIGTFVIIFILSRIDTLWQKYDFVRDLTYFLSLSGRTARMLRGLITTHDVIYFLVVVYMFIAFTLFRLKGTREFKPWHVKASRYVAVMASALLIGYVSSRPVLIGYWDTTHDKTNTLHWRTQDIIKEMGNDELEITLYTNLLGGSAVPGLPVGRNNYLWTLWDHYVRFKPNIKFNYVNYYDYADSGLVRTFPGKTMKEVAVLMADLYDESVSRFIGPQEIRKMIDLEPEDKRLVMQLKYKGRTTFLRTYNDQQIWPGEQQVAAAFKRLLNAKLPKVGFVTGNLERSIYKTGEREFEVHSIAKRNRSALVNLGFDVDTISLDKEDIPADITTLVLADPKTNLSAVTLNKIQNYIDKGGNMLIFGEPGKQHVLNPVLQPMGLRFANGTLVEVTENEMPHMLDPQFTQSGADLAEEDELLMIKDGRTPRIIMPGATAIAYAPSGGFTVKPLLMTTKLKTWLKAGVLVTDSTAPVFSALEGDIMKASFPVAVALAREVNGKQQRVIVSADTDFMSNLRAGGTFLGRAFHSWLTYGKFPIYTPQPKPKDTLLTISDKSASTLRIATVWVLPAAVLLLGTILLIRRKRK